MNLRRCILFVLAGWLAGSPLRASIAPADNPYTPIVERNVFALLPLPPPAPPVDPASLVPPPKITPNGIMTLFGKLQVLFKVAGVTKPGLPPKDESYVMCAGDRQDDIEVQKIDQASATITFNNHGVVQELTLVAGTGGTTAPAPAGTIIPAPGMAPANGGAPAGFGGRFGRNRNNVTSGGNPGAGGMAGFGGIGAATPAPEATGTADNQMTPEQAVIMVEAQRAEYIRKGNPAFKILPPTQFTPPVTGQANPGEAPPQPGD